MANSADGNRSDRKYDDGGDGSSSASVAKSAFQQTLDVACRGGDLALSIPGSTRRRSEVTVPVPAKPLTHFPIIVMPDKKRVAWVSHSRLPETLGTPADLLKQLWALHPLSRSEHGVMFGKPWNSGDRRRTLPVCEAGLAYDYNGSGWTGEAALPTFEQQPLVAQLLDLVCAEVGVGTGPTQLARRPNFCLINFYMGQDSGIGWHSDAEAQLEPGQPIASLSFSTEPRKFDIHENVSTALEYECSRAAPPRRNWRFVLESGDLFVMGGDMQQLTKHAVQPTFSAAAESRRFARVNLTFRVMKTAKK
jgi:alkylated DNA repair dioxygenase AlkB